jgi:hypothetical protein
LRMFDIRLAPFPLDANGAVNSLPYPSGALTYDQLVRNQDASGFYYKDIRFTDIDATAINNYEDGIFAAQVAIQTEVWLDEL